jgi:molybdenum cofactor sulfurtransferase
VAMNFYDPDGRWLDYRRIEELAGVERISLRTGCFCNPGGAETAEGLSEADMRAGVDSGPDITLPRFLQLMKERGDGRSLGAIRVSLGIVSSFADVERFLQFAAGFRDQTMLTIGSMTADDDNCRVIRDGS